MSELQEIIVTMKLCHALSVAVSLVMTATANPVDNIYQRAFQNSEAGKQQHFYNAYEEFVPQNDFEIPNNIPTDDAVFMQDNAWIMEDEPTLPSDSADELKKELQDEQPERSLIQQDPITYYNEFLPQNDIEDNQLDDGVLMQDSAWLMEDEPPLPTDSSEELKQDLLKKPETVVVQGTNVVQHGSIIALQYAFSKAYWLGCHEGSCKGIGSPRMFMTGSDWTRCGGEIFQIYRALGAGPINSGDFVGFYMPYIRGNWFSMWGNRGRRLTCPGMPTTQTGFAHLYNWFLCGGEVFRIFAYEKVIGAAIENSDTVAIYYPITRTYLRFRYNGYVYQDGCMRGLPPNADYFDKCYLNTLELTLKQ